MLAANMGDKGVLLEANYLIDVIDEET